MPHRILIYRNTGNLGDAVQTYAMARLLPPPLYGVYRDAAYAGTDAAAREHTFVVNGWLGDRTPQDRDCLFAGVFIGRQEAENLEWVRRSRFPAGARDPHTHARLKAAGVESHMIGCATLTLARYEGPRSGTVCVDAPGPGDGVHAARLGNWIGDIPWPVQWEMAKALLSRLRTAALVVTSRLHVALPCLAMGTPVVVPPEWRRRLMQPERLSLLDHLRFEYGPPNVIDVAPVARRFGSFLSDALRIEVHPDEEPRSPLVFASD
jgi:hypothetical protein